MKGRAENETQACSLIGGINAGLQRHPLCISYEESCYMRKTRIYICIYIVYISPLLSVHNFCRLLEAVIKENLGNQKA